MKKSDVRDITIRGYDKSAGVAVAPDKSVAAPKTSGNPSAAPTGTPTNPITVIPYKNILPTDANTIGDSGLPQPGMGTAADTDSVGAVTNGQSVAFPDASDRTSAGGAKSVDSFVLKTGSAQPFPAASDTSQQPMMVDNWKC